jgi:cysteine synthase A
MHFFVSDTWFAGKKSHRLVAACGNQVEVVGETLYVAVPETCPTHPDGSPAGGHPAWAPHPLQGWTPDFIPLVTEQAVDMDFIHEIIPVSGPESIAASQALAQKEGIFVGISSGGTFAAAVKVAHKAPPGSNILCMLPDTGERYLSTPLNDPVPVDMTQAELDIFHSTPLGSELVPRTVAT